MKIVERFLNCRYKELNEEMVKLKERIGNIQYEIKSTQESLENLIEEAKKYGIILDPLYDFSKG